MEVCFGLISGGKIINIVAPRISLRLVVSLGFRKTALTFFDKCNKGEVELSAFNACCIN